MNKILVVVSFLVSGFFWGVERGVHKPKPEGISMAMKQYYIFLVIFFSLVKNSFN